MSLTGCKVGTGLAWPFAVLAELGPVVQKNASFVRRQNCGKISMSLLWGTHLSRDLFYVMLFYGLGPIPSSSNLKIFGSRFKLHPALVSSMNFSFENEVINCWRPKSPKPIWCRQRDRSCLLALVERKYGSSCCCHLDCRDKSYRQIRVSAFRAQLTGFVSTVSATYKPYLIRKSLESLWVAIKFIWEHQSLFSNLFAAKTFICGPLASI